MYISYVFRPTAWFALSGIGRWRNDVIPCPSSVQMWAAMFFFITILVSTVCACAVTLSNTWAPSHYCWIKSSKSVMAPTCLKEGQLYVSWSHAYTVLDVMRIHQKYVYIKKGALISGAVRFSSFLFVGALSVPVSLYNMCEGGGKGGGERVCMP